jgi:hypothetical protein
MIPKSVAAEELPDRDAREDEKRERREEQGHGTTPGLGSRVLFRSFAA